MGARLSRAAERRRADQEGGRAARGARADRAGLRARAASARSASRTSATGCVGGVSTRSGSRACPASEPGAPSPRSSRTSTSCCGSGSTAGVSPRSSSARSPGRARRYGRDIADVTDRQNVQLHWIRIEDVPAIFEPARGHRPHDRRGVRRHAPRDPRVPPGGDRRGRDLGRVARDRGDPRPVRRHDRILEPPAQVQDVDQRMRRPLHGSRDQRHLARRRGAPRPRPRLRPLGRWRALDEPDVRPAPRRVRRPRPRRRDVGRGDVAVPRVRVPALAQPVPAEVPRQGLGSRGVPSGAREGVPRGTAARRARAASRPDGSSRPRRGPSTARRPDVCRVHPPRRAPDGPSAAPRGRPRRSVRERPGSGPRRGRSS